MIKLSDADDVLARLRAFGAPVRASELPKDLYEEILASFGSIGNARAAAGLPTAVPAKRRWSEAAVVEELRRLAATGLRIRERELNDAGHSGVVEAAHIYCGGLIRARRLARITVDEAVARAREPWDAERVIAEIRARHADGQPLAKSKVDPRLYLAGRRYFGAWSDAIEAAGLDYAQVRMHAPPASVDQLLAQLRALAEAEPELSASALEGHQLGYMLRRRFTSLAAAIQAAGIPAGWPRRARQALPDASETIAGITARRAAGLALTRAAVRVEDRTLLRAAERHFGTWLRAIAEETRSAPEATSGSSAPPSGASANE